MMSISNSILSDIFILFVFEFESGHKYKNKYDIIPTYKTTRTHGPLYSSSIRHSQQDSFLYTQFSRTHPSSISSSIHCGTHLSLYLNISICDLVLKDLLKRI
jgi:hypothetical protein